MCSIDYSNNNNNKITKVHRTVVFLVLIRHLVVFEQTVVSMLFRVFQEVSEMNVCTGFFAAYWREAALAIFLTDRKLL